MFHVKQWIQKVSLTKRSHQERMMNSAQILLPTSTPQRSVGWLGVGLVLSLLCTQIVSVDDADARRPKRKKKAQISSALQELRWGESHNQVIKYLAKVIKKRYKKIITRTLDGSKADRLRREMKQEVKDLRKDYIEFSGQRTGYSVSFLKTDFMHNNGETLLKFDEDALQPRAKLTRVKNSNQNEIEKKLK